MKTVNVSKIHIEKYRYFLLILIFTYCKTLHFDQNESVLIYTKYYHSANKLDTSFFISLSKLNIPIFHKVESKYIRTDTVSGIEIDYYYLQDGRTNKCSNLTFFAPAQSLEKYKNIYNLFETTAVCIIEQSYFSNMAPHYYCEPDTFYYSNNITKYLEQNFSNITDQPVYKLSSEEFIKVFEVNVLADLFEGNTEFNNYFFPFLTRDLPNENKILIQYRKVITREPLHLKNPFGLKLVPKLKLSQCYQTYH